MARESGLESKFGSFYDSTLDRISEIVVFMGLLSLYNNYGPELADRIRPLLADAHGLTEQKMFGGIGWAFGGSISYMQVISYTHSGQPESVLYGFAGTYLIGFLWAAMGGAGIAYPQDGMAAVNNPASISGMESRLDLGVAARADAQGLDDRDAPGHRRLETQAYAVLGRQGSRRHRPGRYCYQTFGAAACH